MFLLTARQAKAIDRKAEVKLGIPALLLMENAGRGIADEALKVIKGRSPKVAVFCGKGNNGGDGFCVARHLLLYGIKPEIFLAGRYPEVKNEAKINLDILLRLKQRIIEVTPENLGLVRKKLSKCTLAIDALLGVGLNGQVRGAYRDLINILNDSGIYILSVDIPSGLDATSGKVLGVCVKADKTVTFLAKKRGMALASGRKYCGKVIIRDLGVDIL